MRITAVELTDFRSYHSWRLEPDPGLTVLVGPNAAGKTNAVEAIRLLTTGTSFRRPRWEELVRWGEARTRAAMTAEAPGRKTDVSLDVNEDGSRSFTVNGKHVASGADVAGLVPSVVFTPDDLGMVKGPADRRRGEIDELGQQLSATYGRLRREYDRVVRQRNQLLKEDERDASLLAAWDERLVDLGSRLRQHRARLVGRVAVFAGDFHRRVCAGEELDVRYVKGPQRARVPVDSAVGPDEERRAIRDELEERRAEEEARRVTIVGPHRDDIEFLIGGRDARAFASQGQQRSVVLAWKMAELHVVQEVTGTEAVLLLDDVMSELDADRRRALTTEVGSSVQTILTTTNTGYFDQDLLGRALVVTIRDDAGAGAGADGG